MDILLGFVMCFIYIWMGMHMQSQWMEKHSCNQFINKDKDWGWGKKKTKKIYGDVGIGRRRHGACWIALWRPVISTAYSPLVYSLDIHAIKLLLSILFHYLLYIHPHALVHIHLINLILSSLFFFNHHTLKLLQFT